MFKIENTILPDEKKVWKSLTYVYGIGKTRANSIVKECKINPEIKIKDLTEEEMNSITKFIKKFTLGERLDEEIKKRIFNKKEMGIYQGDRHKRKLPLNGQRTRHNSRTSKKGYEKGYKGRRKVVAVAGKRKAPTPK